MHRLNKLDLGFPLITLTCGVMLCLMCLPVMI